MSDNPLTLFARWLAETGNDWPDTARTTALHAFIDTVGVALPGALEVPSRIVMATVRP